MVHQLVKGVYGLEGISNQLHGHFILGRKGYDTPRVLFVWFTNTTTVYNPTTLHTCEHTSLSRTESVILHDWFWRSTLSRWLSYTSRPVVVSLVMTRGVNTGDDPWVKNIVRYFTTHSGLNHHVQGPSLYICDFKSPVVKRLWTQISVYYQITLHWVP